MQTIFKVETQQKQLHYFQHKRILVQNSDMKGGWRYTVLKRLLLGLKFDQKLSYTLYITPYDSLYLTLFKQEIHLHSSLEI